MCRPECAGGGRRRSRFRIGFVRCSSSQTWCNAGAEVTARVLWIGEKKVGPGSLARGRIEPMGDTPSSLDTADILAILGYLPHRYPFLLVDRIIEMNGDASCIGIKNVTYNEPQFTGHF